MNKKNAKIEALLISSIVISELEGSDAIENNKIRLEIHKIASHLAKRADNLSQTKLINIKK